MYNKEIIIIRNKEDIIKASKIIYDIKKIDITNHLTKYFEVYDQFIFSVDDGSIIAARFQGELSVSTSVIYEHFGIKEYEVNNSSDTYKIFLFDKESGEILLAQYLDGNIIASGKILYDSINP